MIVWVLLLLYQVELGVVKVHEYLLNGQFLSGLYRFSAAKFSAFDRSCRFMVLSIGYVQRIVVYNSNY